MDWLMITAVIGGVALAFALVVAIGLRLFDVAPPAADAGTNKDARPD